MKLKIAKTLKGLPTVDYRELTPLQGNLKDLSEINYAKLKKSLDEFGFIVPLFIWKKKGKNFIIDAHQRHRLLSKEKAEPFYLPYVEIEAKDEKEAKQKLLVISSQYGKITQEGFDEFVFDLPEEWITDTVNFDALFEPFEEEKQEAQEDDYEIPETIKTSIKLGDIFEIKRGVKCPKCDKIHYL